jgi:hypothetical protein
MKAGSRSSSILAAAVTLGVLGDVLLRADGTPGLNLLLLSVATAAAALLLHRRSGLPLSAEAKVLMGAGVLFSLGFVWRDAAILKLLGIATVWCLYSLPAFRAGLAWVTRSTVGEYIAAFVRTALHGVGGAALTVAEVDWDAWREERSRTRWHGAAAAARGLVLAVPVIIVFGALFIAADAVFARMVTRLFRMDLEVIASHVVMTGVLAWLATGYLRNFLTERTALPVPASLRGARLGIIEGGVLLTLVSALFLVFVVVQFRYLFGGGALVEVTPGLTYAEYARRGFMELVAVVALTLPLLLAVEWLLRDATQRGRAVFRGLAGLQVVLVLCVMASALQRMRLYQHAYGLTEQRLYATAFLILLAVVLVLFVLTVLRGRRDAFALGTLTAVCATLATLFVLNPDAVIARTNVARLATVDAAAEFDAGYLANLSGDAVPVLLARYPALPAQAQCVIAKRLLERWPPDETPDLRAWSWSAARASRAVAAQAAQLRTSAAPCSVQASSQASTSVTE